MTTIPDLPEPDEDDLRKADELFRRYGDYAVPLDCYEVSGGGFGHVGAAPQQGHHPR